MATNLFLRDTASDINPGSAIEKAAVIAVRGDGVNVSTTNTQTTPISPIVCTDTAGGSQLVWYSSPLEAVTISGTVTFNVWMAESNMSANAGSVVNVDRCDGAGAVISTICSNSAKGTELPVTTRAAQNWTASPTSTTLSAGDRIKITVKIGGAGGSMASGHTCTLGYDGTTGAADGDSFVTFTENLVVFSGAADVSGTDAAVLAEATGTALAGSDSHTVDDSTYALGAATSDSAAFSERATLTVTAVGSDAHTLSETGSATATAAAVDSAAVGETGALSVPVVGSDSAVLADVTYVLGSAASDSASLTAESPSMTAALTHADAASAADAGQIGIVGSDSATLAEASSYTAVVAHSDTLALGDTGTVAAVFAGSDTSTFTDNDGTATVTGSNIDKDGTDSATLTESVSIQVTLVASDSGALAETPSVAATVAGADSGTLADSGSLSAALVHADSATIAELFASIVAVLTHSDSLAVGDTGSPVEQLGKTDTDFFTLADTGVVEVGAIFNPDEDGRGDATVGGSGGLAPVGAGGAGVTLGNTGRTNAQVTSQ